MNVVGMHVVSEKGFVNERLAVEREDPYINQFNHSLTNEIALNITICQQMYVLLLLVVLVC